MTGFAGEAWPCRMTSCCSARGATRTRKRPARCARSESSAFSASRCMCISDAGRRRTLRVLGSQNSRKGPLRAPEAGRLLRALLARLRRCAAGTILNSFLEAIHQSRILVRVVLFGSLDQPAVRFHFSGIFHDQIHRAPGGGTLRAY